MFIKDWINGIKDKRVLVVGLGRSGLGAANLLASFGAKVSVTEKKGLEDLKEYIERLDPSVVVHAGRHAEELFRMADLIVISPGVALDIEPMKVVTRGEVPVIGELELSFNTVTTPFIAITGTNGKSTVTTLVDIMLRKGGFRTICGGNIGNALTGEILKIVGNQARSTLRSEAGELKVDYIVAEASSFQLETIAKFKPRVAAILNITPDHLDRHKDMNTYISAKSRIFENQGPEDYLILNADDQETMKLYSEKLKMQNAKISKIYFFSRKKEVEGIYFKDGVIYYNLPNSKLRAPNSKLIPANEIKIKGVHNLENAMAASAIALVSGCPAQAVRDVLVDFPGLEHRIEFVEEINGVSFINDSKGTNVGAVVKSLESFQEIILIMGGRDKASDFSILKDLVRQRVKALILLGEAKGKIAEALGSLTETVFVKDMREAVEISAAKARRGDVVMLSPGCTSLDMFRDFEDRGRKFKEAVKELKGALL